MMAEGCGEEFEEEEVWAAVTAVRGTKTATPRTRKGEDDSFDVDANSRTSRRIQFPRLSGGGGELGRSAPLRIPDWSKVFKHGRGDIEEEEEEEDDVGEDGDPPHEWLAKKMAKSQLISLSSSVCEGAGRTLKGRDLSKVRNAVLTRTGFLE
ncbi:hypothetical protein ZIOFF_052916 [Zingiber officinale]|uniref:Senescence regulator n=2 Tax=Zingiber officinale TaxID=94328 RepID=A0A8J5KLL8_ZINOF|nr:hypothetical protein ZIOFF_052916 [Zingiber officinale]